MIFYLTYFRFHRATSIRLFDVQEQIVDDLLLRGCRFACTKKTIRFTIFRVSTSLRTNKFQLPCLAQLGWPFGL